MSSILILHLSDLHFKAYDNSFSERAEALAAAVRAETEQRELVVIAITGDIAFSGKSSEYAEALVFLGRLKNAIEQGTEATRVEYVVIPGNHDCDFQLPSELRELAIENVASRLETIGADGEIANQCLSVQAEFFKFVLTLTGKAIPSADRLYYEHEISLGDHRIRFQCHNTAWVSRLHERPGQLVYPVVLASAADSPSRTVSAALSLLHHPFPWFQPINRRSVVDLIERTSDVILTGHEHVTDSYRRDSQSGSACDYLEGGLFQDSSNPEKSEFRVVNLDLVQGTFQHATYRWAAGLYERVHRTDSTSFRRNPLLVQHALDSNPKFAATLVELGTGFSHPRRQNLSLPDVFIYPDLSRRKMFQTKQEEPVRATVKSREVLDFISTKRNLVITGAATSGKTSLAKTLYVDLKKRKGVVPLMLNGASLKGVRSDRFRTVCATEFEEQYSHQGLQRFEQLEASQRLILIDDFDKARLTSKGQKEILEAAKAFAGSVIVLADDLFMIDLLSHSGEATHDVFDDFELCTIRLAAFHSSETTTLPFCASRLRHRPSGFDIGHGLLGRCEGEADPRPGE